MRRIIVFAACCLFFSCNDINKKPDVSNIKVSMKLQRFEQGLFAMDSASLYNHLDSLLASYPTFGDVFMQAVLNCDPRWSQDTLTSYIYSFTGSPEYRSLYDTAEIIFKDFTPYQAEIEKGIRYQKYYFPQYHSPEKIITYIGPLDGRGDGLWDDALAIGLHHHLGKQSSFYQSEWLQSTYPPYITRRFEPDNIAVNCMSSIIQDMYPENAEDSALVVQMIEKGKRLFLLQQFLPDYREYQLIGYTEGQLKDCYAHEAMIWNFFTQNELLQNSDYNAIKNYVTEGPKTQELGDASPGNIGSFVGWQIVKRFMKKNGKTKLDQLMGINAEQLLNEAKYKP